MVDFLEDAVCKDLLLLDTSKGGLQAVHAFQFRHRPVPNAGALLLATYLIFWPTHVNKSEAQTPDNVWNKLGLSVGGLITTKEIFNRTGHSYST